jgi:hypothetical protein
MGRGSLWAGFWGRNGHFADFTAAWQSHPFSRRKDFVTRRVWLSGHAYLVVAFVMVKGEIVSFVVRLMLMQDGGRQVNVARYDTAHGMAHCDVLGERQGLLQKIWLLNESLETSLRRAIDDFKLNYEDYIRNYLQN